MYEAENKVLNSLCTPYSVTSLALHPFSPTGWKPPFTDLEIALYLPAMGVLWTNHFFFSFFMASWTLFIFFLSELLVLKPLLVIAEVRSWE